MNLQPWCLVGSLGAAFFLLQLTKPWVEPRRVRAECDDSRFFQSMTFYYFTKLNQTIRIAILEFSSEWKVQNVSLESVQVDGVFKVTLYKLWLGGRGLCKRHRTEYSKVIGWKIHQSRKGRKRGIVLAVSNEVKGVPAAMNGACLLKQIFEIICISVSVNIHVEIEIVVQQQLARGVGKSFQ